MRPLASSLASSTAAAAASAAASQGPSEIPGEEEEGALEDAASSEEEEGEAEAAELSEEEEDALDEVRSPGEGGNLSFSQKVRLLKIPDQHVNSSKKRVSIKKMRKKRKGYSRIFKDTGLSAAEEEERMSGKHSKSMLLHDACTLHMLSKATMTEAMLPKIVLSEQHIVKKYKSG